MEPQHTAIVIASVPHQRRRQRAMGALCGGLIGLGIVVVLSSCAPNTRQSACGPLLVSGPISYVLAAAMDQVCALASSDGSSSETEPTVEPTIEALQRRTEIQARAEQGDAEAQYELYLSGSVEEEWKWLCRSAHGGHALAQVATGLIYSWGMDGKVTDPVLAYLWYSLAAINGHRSINSERDALAKTMTPTQIAEAERLAAEWKPDPASCEAEAKAASK